MPGRVIPMVSYEDVGGAADWLVSAFGFDEVAFERARAAGATILTELEDNPAAGQRQYRAADPEGHRWMFAQPG